MYTVIWCDHEGNQRDIQLKTLEDARLEAEELDKQYDGVHILDANGNEATRLFAIRRRAMSDAYIFRRTSRYPPRMLYHLGLITHSEYTELIGSEWYGWNFLLERDVLFYR